MTYKALDKLTPEQRRDVEAVIPYLDKWKGEMSLDSIGATIYSTW